MPLPQQKVFQVYRQREQEPPKLGAAEIRPAERTSRLSPAGRQAVSAAGVTDPCRPSSTARPASPDGTLPAHGPSAVGRAVGSASRQSAFSGAGLGTCWRAETHSLSVLPRAVRLSTTSEDWQARAESASSPVRRTELIFSAQIRGRRACQPLHASVPFSLSKRKPHA